MSLTTEPGQNAIDTLADPNETPEEKWVRTVYRGTSVPQLTIRAVVTGMLLGAVMSLSNVYISLKTGFSFGVTITAGILGFAIWGVVRRVAPGVREFGMLENNAMQSVASAAGYMCGGGTMAALPAMMLATHQTLDSKVIFLWITAIATLGVFMAIPMKRQMINHEQLRFPSGIAAAETLKSLHAAGTEAAGRARSLLIAGGVGAVIMWWREAFAPWLPYWHLPEKLPLLPFKIKGVSALQWTWAFDTSLVLMAAGGIMGWRSAWSLMLGAAVNYGFLAPYGSTIHAFPVIGYGSIVRWTVWFGSSLLLTSGLLSFAFSWRQIARAFGGVAKFLPKRAKNPGYRDAAQPGADKPDPLDDIEVPMSWFVIGTLCMTPIVVFLASWFFGMAWWMGILCIVLSFFIAVVACRATGETDTTPTGALGKIMQIVAGIAAPGSVIVNLMAANLGAGVAIHSADLLTDLKSGYILGARPRQQFFAQFFGVLAGSMAVVPAFRLFIPDWHAIGTELVPAPAAIAWHSVAQVLARGLSQLPVSARWLALAGGSIGIILTLAERLFPKYKRFIPSAVGFGLAFTMPASNSVSMFLGAAIALALEARRPALADRYVIPVSSGIIAGESLTGILIKALGVLGVLHAASHH